MLTCVSGYVLRILITNLMLFLSQRARRKESKRSFLRSRRKRERTEATTKKAPPDPTTAITAANGLDETGPLVAEASFSMEITKNGNGVTTATAAITTNPFNSLLKPPPLPATATLQHVQKLPSETTTEPAPSDAVEIARKVPPVQKKDAVTRPKGPVQFRALADDGTLDIYTYHRGREGMELRDKETGELLCDVKATDTNHNVDAPKLVAAVVVKFPLEDDSAASEVKTGARYYRETVAWDLADPGTSTPAAFAADVAESFGLSFDQYLDLTESIQTQLATFVQENCGHATPIALRDALGQTRDAPAPFVCDLYGEVTGSIQGGSSYSANQRSKPVSRSASVVGGAVGGQKSNTKGKAPRKAQASTKVEEAYREEVQRRLRAASIARIHKTCEASGKAVGQLDIACDSVCHSCSEQKELSGVFACGSSSHALCEDHLRPWVDLSIPTSAPPSLDFCPACSLACTCSLCGRILELAAQEFKKRTLKQETAPVLTVFDDLFGYCHSPGLKERAAASTKSTASKSGVSKSAASKSQKLLAKRRQSMEKARIQVSKVSVPEFPREVCNGIDMDPGTELDYRTVYTNKGAFVPPAPEVAPAARTQDTTIGQIEPKPVPEIKAGTSPPSEDGSVDYCNVCRKHGNLLCCDYCPRAFHQGCIKPEAVEGPSDAPWECPACCMEKFGLPEHEIDGEKSLALICATFGKQQVTVTQEDTSNLRLLSIIHQMLLGLMEYDFGYMFAEPVDCKQITNYKTLVKRPMDLGTIASNLINGRYIETFSKEQVTSWDDIALAILKDIELVWHNCFTFNYEGSAVYRMAEVQRRRFLITQQRSFQSYISERVMQEVAVFVQQCERERGKIADLDSKLGSESVSLSLAAVKARHKITVKPQTANGRPVAVFDSDTGKLAKIYTSQITAASAIDFLHGLGHPSEWGKLGPSSNTNSRVRRLVKESKTDPRRLLFGYRWFLLEDLKKGKVQFLDSVKSNNRGSVRASHTNGSTQLPRPTLDVKVPAPAFEAIEMVDNQHSYVFSTIEESLLFPRSLDQNARQHLRERLKLLVSGGSFVEIEGRKWRRLRINPEDLTEEKSETEKSKLSLSEQKVDSTKVGSVQLPRFLVVKEDLLAGSKLIYFPSIEGAYRDWLNTCESSPVTIDGPKSMATFQSSYLCGDRNVDGIVWTMTSKSATREAPPPGSAVEGIETVQKRGLTGFDHASNSIENASVSALPPMANDSTSETPTTNGDGLELAVAERSATHTASNLATAPMQISTLSEVAVAERSAATQPASNSATAPMQISTLFGLAAAQRSATTQPAPNLATAPMQVSTTLLANGAVSPMTGRKRKGSTGSAPDSDEGQHSRKKATAVG